MPIVVIPQLDGVSDMTPAESINSSTRTVSGNSLGCESHGQNGNPGISACIAGRSISSLVPFGPRPSSQAAGYPAPKEPSSTLAYTNACRPPHATSPISSWVLGRSPNSLSAKYVTSSPQLAESAGVYKFHDPTRNTFITSSPRWLITLTAMRPVSGLGKGREVSLLRVAQASASISAFRVVLRER